MKIIRPILFSMALAMTGNAYAQSNLGKQAKDDLLQKTTFGGYVIGKASATDKDLDGSTKSHSNFDLRDRKSVV